MRIVLRTARVQSDAWRTALGAALPDAEIAVWPALPFDPDYVLAWRPSAALFERVRTPKAIFNLGAGVDGLLGLPTLPPDVPVIRLEDAGMAAPMAEYVALAVLAAHRQQGAYACQQRQARWEGLPQRPAREFRVGCLGLGILGQACIAALRPFGFALLGWSRERRELEGVETFAGRSELSALLARTDALICMLPATRETVNLLDARRLRELPRGAHLINVARGELVVDADLIALLDEGHLASATLDVFRAEPLPPGHPFWHHPRVVVTPHVSAATVVEHSIAQIAAKIRRLERGEPVTGVVDRTRGY